MSLKIPPPPKDFTSNQKEIYYSVCEQLIEDDRFHKFDIESIYDASLIFEYIDFDFKRYPWEVRHNG